MKITTASLLVALLIMNSSYAQNFKVTSPDKRIVLSVDVNDNLTWQATLDETEVVSKSVIGMEFSKGTNFGIATKLKSHVVSNVSQEIIPGVPHKNASIKDEYQELILAMKGNYEVQFRAYNDGVAYRFVDAGKLERNVMSEQMSLSFPNGSRSLFPEEESMYSHNERIYLDKGLNEISEKQFCSLPVLFNTEKAKVLFTETALHDYPGMFVRGNGSSTVDAIFPKYILEIEDQKAQPDRNQTILKEADYIAQVSGKRAYPWRVFIVGDDKTLIESNLTYQLAEPSAIANTDWITPGKVAWDWYNANNIYGVDFKSGLNTATYKYYIDFASKNGIEYVILDEGWTKSTTEILDNNPDMDVPELIRYGKEKGVELILWVLWKPLDANMKEILETYASWGVKGIKVDFMQRNDQYMVSSYERIAKECARLKLLVDFHGAFKPSGLRRKYPNVINYEGVKGSENNKWSKDITPKHNVTIPFIRMAAGPMDYTPGAMINRHMINYVVSFERPMSLGTRAHQVAMYVIYEAPLQMLCESPSTYYKEQETVDFITQIPTVWDETKVLHGKVGEYVVIARRRGSKWYIGAMTNETGRTLKLDLSFLADGRHVLNYFADGINAARYAEDYQTGTQEVSNKDTIEVSLAGGGGWATIIE